MKYIVYNSIYPAYDAYQERVTMLNIKLDKDQIDTVLSVCIIVCATLFSGVFLPVTAILLIFPLQYAITYLLFCKHPIKKVKSLYVDYNSNKTWNVSLSNTLPMVGATLMFFAALLAIANEDHSKVLSVAILLSPLILTRTVVFIHKLPLMALYPAVNTRLRNFQSYNVYAHTEF